MRLFLGRFVSIVIFGLGWIFTGVRTVLDLIGYATVPDDAKVAQELVERLLIWIMSLPIWLPWGFTLVATLWLMWVSWPRSVPLASPVTQAPRADPSGVVQRGKAKASGTPRRAASFPAPEGMIKSERDDFDLIPHRFLLRAKRTDDGIDVSAIIQYRNRSKRPLWLAPLTHEFTLEGKVTMSERKSSGISVPIAAETSDGIHFNAIRIYKETDPGGTAEFTVMFGQAKDTMRSALRMHYDFTVRSYPENKSTDAVLEADVAETVEYYVIDPASD